VGLIDRYIAQSIRSHLSPASQEDVLGMGGVSEVSGREPPSRRISSFSSDAVHPALQDIDPTTRFFYTPHTITGLILGISLTL